ncbi:histone deacetylase [Streptomyces scopuliridis]|nr:histone deacetylase [Streptomyces scopuliridis]WSB34879.1 histone deacetylase [Streptomyces scopuliridis]
MISPRVIQRRESGSAPPGQVWYTSYGSNTCLERLSYYIVGGRPPGAARAYPGCRDTRLPRVSVPVELDGVMYFATESPVWGGGRAFYDPGVRGRVLARAHLVSVGQFSDIAAQEMYREPGVDLDLTEALSKGRAVLGGGRYEALVCPGALDGVPVLTFTAPWSVDELEWNKPSASYVRVLGSGLLEAGAWDVDTVARYLAACPGAAGRWTAREVEELIAESE